MVELDHPFQTGKPIDENYKAILDLERLVPCVEGGSVIEKVDPEQVKAEIKVKMGAMSLKFKGTVAVVEQDPDAHRDGTARPARGVECLDAQNVAADAEPLPVAPRAAVQPLAVEAAAEADLRRTDARLA